MTVREFYERLLGQPLPQIENDNPNVSVRCFHHEDEHESCSINLENGLWYCHTSGTGGNMQRAYALVKNVSVEKAKEEMKDLGVDLGVIEKGSTAEEREPKVIDAEIAEHYARNLWHSKDPLVRARKEFGWSDETMRRFQIGWDPGTKRYTFPIRDKQGRLVNFRMYNPDATGKNKMINWTDAQKNTGYGSGRLFPIESLRSKTIVINEGEKDCVLMNQVLTDNKVNDWAAITGTGGAGTWKSSWNEEFRNKDVVIIYDRDEAGIENGQRVGAQLVQVAMSVRIVQLDITEPKNADITDYFVSSSKGWDDLKKLIDDTDLFTPATKRQRPTRLKDTNVYRPHLSQASDESYINKILELKAMVSGKDLAPFAVPARVVFECNMDAGKMCESCAMKTQNGVIELELQKDDPDLINLIRVPDHQRDTHIKARRGISTKCSRLDMEIEKWHNIEEVTLVPEIDFAEAEREYVSRTAYVTEHGVVPNRSYILQGTSVPHPKTQHVTHFIPKIQPAQDNIDDFVMDEAKLQRLRMFQPNSGQTVREKFEEIAHDLSLNITRIYGREDLVLAVDLCYHTVLAFDFQGKPAAKTWGDIMIVGDTGTGKTETVQALISHYRLGELNVGENTSFAGLVGGLKQEAGKRWSITWGRIPLNDRRLLVIDEVSGLNLDDIGAMSGIRSSGIAEITKIVTQKTMARTRMIWISNPRSNRSMSQYGHGVEVLRDLIGRPEDIRRFDFVVSAATNEVPIEVINARKHEQVEHRYTSDLCRLLVLWAWSRKSKDVHFTEGATRRILELATEQSQRYASQGGIPLVEAGNHRIKLAKLAVATAVRMFSTKDGVQVDVKSEHVEFAASFLDQIFEKSSLDYAGWSRVILSKTNVPKELLDQALEWVKDHPDWAELWLNYGSLRAEDFRNQFDLEPKEVKSEILKPLARWRMIERGPASTFRKTPAFVTVLKAGLEEATASGVSTSPAADDDIPF